MHELLTAASAILLHPALHSLTRYLTHSAGSLAIVGAAAWLGDRMLRKAGPEAQHRMWVAALLIAVALPWVPAGLLTSYGGAPDAGGAYETATITYQMIAAAAARWTMPPMVALVLAVGYLLTVVFTIARLLWGWWGACAMARRAADVQPEPQVCALLEDAARRFGVALPEVRCSAETPGPMVLGVWRAVLLVPEGFFQRASGDNMHTVSDDKVRTLSNDDIAAAMAHECAHIARRDFAKNLFYACVAAAVAYHPAYWLMRRRIGETRELVCDEMAAGALGDGPEYAACLLRLARAMTAPGREHVRATPAIGVFDANILEERIMRLTMDLPKVTRGRRIATAVVVTCVLAGGAACAMALPFEVATQETATALGHEKVYKIGGEVRPPVLTYSVDAEYTQKAKRAKHEGVSIVSCVIDSHGMPQHVHTVKKLGMGLDEKALDAVRQFRFAPSMLNGKPVAVEITIEVNFHIY